jgi:hypothetical protein
MSWLLFLGSAQKIVIGWKLVPQDEQSAEIEMESDDVRLESGRIFVRQGSYARRIMVPVSSPARRAPMVLSPKQCPTGRSRCLGGIEYCCDNQTMDSCNGLWDDCSP